MKTVDPGHIYLLDEIDDQLGLGGQWLCFVKRVGEGYPGNGPPAHPGTTAQEVLRVLIDRIKYVNGQEPSQENIHVLLLLRRSIYALESRAARKRGGRLPVWFDDDAPYPADRLMFDIENEPTCESCGHIRCGKCGDAED